MDPLTQLLLTSTLVALVGFLVLVFPLLFLFAGQFRPIWEEFAAQRAAAAVLPRSAGAPARRTAATRKPAPRGKVAITKTGLTSKKKAAKKKAASKKKAAKKKASATRSKSDTKAKAKTKAAPKKKAAAPKKKAAKNASKAPAGAKVDPTLGVIYTKKPKDADDLKRITGVAKVLEGKLHQHGVYTYKQIADWKSSQMEAFGELLSFKNRIQRDDWKKQAKALHKEKHG